MNLTDEVFGLATEVLHINPSDDNDEYKCNMAMEDGELITSGDLLYTLPETPDYLVKIECMKILATEACFVYTKKNPFEREMGYVPWGRDRLLKGLMAVEFDLQKLRTWKKQELDKRLNIIDTNEIERRVREKQIVKTVEIDGIGYVELSNNERTKIGEAKHRQYRILLCIEQKGFVGEFDYNTLFESIRLKKDSDNRDLIGQNQKEAKFKIISNTIKTLQRGPLKGLISLQKFNKNDRMIKFS